MNYVWVGVGSALLGAYVTWSIMSYHFSAYLRASTAEWVAITEGWRRESAEWQKLVGEAIERLSKRKEGQGE